MDLLGKKDLFNRWVYTRQGVHKLVKGHDFPAPYLVANKGRLLAWRECDIEAYEHARPELRDEVAKLTKTRSKARDSPATVRRQISNVEYLGGADFNERWCYSRQAVHWIQKYLDFPDPSFIFNQGKGKVWDLADVIAYERKHPELIDLEIKKEKVRLHTFIWSKWG